MLKLSCRLSLPTEQVVLGRFLRDGRHVLLLGNISREPYRGLLAVDAPSTWHVMDPATGKITSADTDAAGQVRLELPGRRALLLVQ